MRYMGSKSRLARYILPFMLQKMEPKQWWVEPFVGGGNVIDKVPGKRLGGDIDRYAIEALVSIRDHVGELPRNSQDFGEADYKSLKTSDGYDHKGYAGYAFSRGGKWMGGWRRGRTGRRDYVSEAYRNALKQSPLIQGVDLINASYLDLPIPPKSLIYCDPPHAGETKHSHEFDHAVFWEWCLDMSRQGHTVFTSQYAAPIGFECVWSNPRRRGSVRGGESLFLCNGR